MTSRATPNTRAKPTDMMTWVKPLERVGALILVAWLLVISMPKLEGAIDRNTEALTGLRTSVTQLVELQRAELVSKNK